MMSGIVAYHGCRLVAMLLCWMMLDVLSKRPFPGPQGEKTEATEVEAVEARCKRESIDRILQLLLVSWKSCLIMFNQFCLDATVRGPVGSKSPGGTTGYEFFGNEFALTKFIAVSLAQLHWKNSWSWFGIWVRIEGIWWKKW